MQRNSDAAQKSRSEASPSPVDAHEAPTIISSRQNKITLDQRIIERIPSRQLGPYQLIETVGTGGMAAVVRALDTSLHRTVALKILPPEMAQDSEHLERFRQEARAAAKLDNDNIARVYSIGEDQGLNFIAFEFVEGENLRQRMSRVGGRLSIAEAVPLMMQVAAGLSHAASRGVVHRDIKPSNILITPEGKAKIVDMGLARSMDNLAFDGGITQSGITLGTFDYISPEQAIDPRRTDIRSDIYSLGCTFYHAITGRPPVPEGTATQKLQFHQNTEPIDPRRLNPLISEELTMILARMMAKDANQRYQHPDQLIQHLYLLTQKEQIGISSAKVETLPRDLTYNEPILPEPPRFSRTALVIAVSLLLGIFTWILGGFRNKEEPIASGPFWVSEKEKKSNSSTDTSEPSNTAPNVNSEGPQTASNVMELRKLIEQGVSSIVLKPGETYDLSRALRKDDPVKPLKFSASQLVLDGGDGVSPALLIMKIPTPLEERMGSPHTLQIADTVKKIKLRGVQIEWISGEGVPVNSAWKMPLLESFQADRCAFVTTSSGLVDMTSGPTAQIEFPGDADLPPTLSFDRCYFGPSKIGIRLIGPTEVHCRECAFAPSDAAFKLSGDIGPGKATEIQLKMSSVMMKGGSFLEVDDSVPFHFSADQSIFSSSDETSSSMGILVRQLGDLSKDSRMGYVKESDGGSGFHGNAYHNTAILQLKDMNLGFAECAQQNLPFVDGKAVQVGFPWDQRDPLKKLYDPQLPLRSRLNSAFRVMLKRSALRIPGSPQNVFGLDNMLGSALYDSPLPQPFDAKLASTRIVQPDLPETETQPAGVYRSLRNAIEEAKPGDEILLHWNGTHDERSVDLDKPNSQLTIRPDENCKPILQLTSRKREQALFKIAGGEIHFENLQFRLRNEKGQNDSSRSIVSLPGGGLCSFKNCVVTFEDQDGMSVVQLEDPRDEMMMNDSMEKWPIPRITFENSLIRGKGKLLCVKSSRSFDLDVKDTLAALNGSLIDINPTTLDVTGVNSTQVHLHRTTTYLTGPLFEILAAAKKLDMKGCGIVPIQALGTQSLFIPASGSTSPLVKMEHVETENLMKDLFNWRGSKDNFYGYDKTTQNLIERTSDNPEALTPMPIDPDRWLELFREKDHPFGKVKFLGSALENGKAFSSLKPADFRRKNDDYSDSGATLETLPTPYGEEKLSPSSN
ncbi:serine/threonine protein kinase [Telmatocola sphagniphila]|uniref:Serine/threonine protein kinase n=1 Tax=Telmatocola sphagniphila TaxID=1123043 RepID=A0A8E6EVL9_9BACT|nr:serine/threonine-protein kinase [Telmatocola sphagniphila]QVL32920.1 serine/threonine protein kinase [Telmatocola sphagniphila]